MRKKRTAAFAAAICIAAGLCSCASSGNSSVQEDTSSAVTENATEEPAEETASETEPAQQETVGHPGMENDFTFCDENGTPFTSGIFSFTVKGKDIRIYTKDEQKANNEENVFDVTLVPADSSSDMHTQVNIRSSSSMHLPAENFLESQLNYYQQFIEDVNYEDITLAGLDGFHIMGLYKGEDTYINYYCVATENGSQFIIGTTSVDSESEDWCENVIKQISETLTYEETETGPITFDCKEYTVSEQNDWYIAFNNNQEGEDSTDVAFYSVKGVTNGTVMYYTSFFSDRSEERGSLQDETDYVVQTYSETDYVKENEETEFRGFPARRVLLDTGSAYMEYTFVELPDATFGIYTNLDHTDEELYKELKADSDALIESLTLKTDNTDSSSGTEE